MSETTEAKPFDPETVERWTDADARHNEPFPPIYVNTQDFDQLLELYRTAQKELAEVRRSLAYVKKKMPHTFALMEKHAKSRSIS